MSIWDWIIIIAKILALIAEGMSGSQAIASTAKRFNVSEKEILEYVRF